MAPGQGDGQALRRVMLSLRQYAAWKVGIKSTTEIAQELLDAHTSATKIQTQHQLAGAQTRHANFLMGSHASQPWNLGESRTSEDTAGSGHKQNVLRPAQLRLIQLVLGSSGDDSRTEAEATLAGAFQLDSDAMRITPRSRIVLSNAVVVLATCTLLLVVSLVMRRDFMANRQKQNVHSLARSVAAFGTGFRTEFERSATFELEDQAETLARWMEYSWATRRRDTLAEAQTAADVAAAGLAVVYGDAARAPSIILDDALRAVVGLVAGPSPASIDLAEAASALLRVTQGQPSVHCGLYALHVTGSKTTASAAFESAGFSSAVNASIAVAAIEAEHDAFLHSPSTRGAPKRWERNVTGSGNVSATVVHVHLPTVALGVVCAVAAADAILATVPDLRAATSAMQAAARHGSSPTDGGAEAVAYVLLTAQWKAGSLPNATASITAHGDASADHRFTQWAQEEIAAARSTSTPGAAMPLPYRPAPPPARDPQAQFVPTGVAPDGEVSLAAWAPVTIACNTTMCTLVAVATFVSLDAERVGFIATTTDAISEINAQPDVAEHVALALLIDRAGRREPTIVSRPKSAGGVQHCFTSSQGSPAADGSGCSSVVREFYDLAAKGFQRRATGSTPALLPDGTPAIGVFAYIADLELVVTVAVSLHSVMREAVSNFKEGVDLINAETSAAFPTAVGLMHLGPAASPKSRTFDPSGPCAPPLTCTHGWRRNSSSATWVGTGVVQRSDCPRCVPWSVQPQALRAVFMTAQSQTAAPESLKLPAALDDLVVRLLAPRQVRDTSALGVPLLEGASLDVAQRLVTNTSLSAFPAATGDVAVENPDGAFVAVRPIPEAGIAVVAHRAVDHDVDRTLVRDALILVFISLGAAVLALLFLRLVAERVVTQIEREWGQHREAQLREQHKVGQVVQNIIPAFLLERVLTAGESNGRGSILVSDSVLDGSVACVDMFRFSDRTQSYSPRNLVRLQCYWRMVVHTVVRHFGVTLLNEYGDTAMIVGGIDGVPEHGLLAVMRACAVLSQLCTNRYVHRPHLIPALVDLFTLSPAERLERDEEAKLAAMQATKLRRMQSRHGMADAGGKTRARKAAQPAPVLLTPDTESELDTLESDESDQVSASDSSQDEYRDRAAIYGPAGAPAGRSKRARRKPGIVEQQTQTLGATPPFPGAAKPTQPIVENFRLLSVKVGVHVGLVTFGATMMEGVTPQFDCFSGVFGVVQRLQATAPPNRMHVSAQTRDIVVAAQSQRLRSGPAMHHRLDEGAFEFTNPTKTVLKGATGNVVTYQVAAFFIPIPDAVLQALQVGYADVRYKFVPTKRAGVLHGSDTSSVSTTAGIEPPQQML